MPDEECLSELVNLLNPDDSSNFSHEEVANKAANSDTSTHYLIESGLISGYKVKTFDNRLYIEAEVDSEDFKPSNVRPGDYAELFPATYETVYSIATNLIDFDSGDFEELEISINDTTNSSHVIYSSEMEETRVGDNNIERDYLTLEHYQKHLNAKIGDANRQTVKNPEIK